MDDKIIKFKNRVEIKILLIVCLIIFIPLFILLISEIIKRGFNELWPFVFMFSIMNLWMSDSFNPALAGKTFGSRFVEFMSFNGANTVSSTLFGTMYGLFEGAASLTKYLIEQEISKPTTASAFNY